MNNCSFIGNLGADAEVRTTQGGAVVTTFRLAINSGYGKNKKTTWLKCNYWGDRGEKIAHSLLKGKKIGVTGELSLEEYKTKEGVERQSLDLRVNDISFLEPVAKPSAEFQSTDKPPFDDDIPF